MSALIKGVEEPDDGWRPGDAVEEPVGMGFHPLANLFPLIEGSEFDALVADVAENGLREPILLDKPRDKGGLIVDGRNRYRAAMAAGRSLIFEVAPPGVNLLRLVISRNLRRRHLKEGQRAMIAARLATMDVGRPPIAPAAKTAAQIVTNGVERAWSAPANMVAPPLDLTGIDVGATPLPTETPPIGGISAHDAGGLLNVSTRSVERARVVLESAAPEVQTAVEQGDIAVSAAADIARLPIEQQRAIIAKADPKAFNAEVKRVRAEKQEAKKERRGEREAELGARQRALPDKRYGVIYADPEWRFEPYSRETGMDRAPDNHYPTSETFEIINRPVGSIADKDSVLLLWATAPMLQAALKVMAGWGFEYKTHLIWSKLRPGAARGTGYWFTGEHELLLLGTKGSPPAPAPGTQWPSVMALPVGEHSAKPDEFAELIEEYFPSLPKIELNARRARPGWDVWGLEAPDGAGASGGGNG